MLTLPGMEKTLGSEIRRLRLEAGFTLRKFATRVGISAAHQSDIEHGRRMPSENLLRSITETLAHVGASFESFRQLDTRLGAELEEWIQQTPEARQLLREAKSSGKPIADVLKDLRALLGRDEEGAEE